MPFETITELIDKFVSLSPEELKNYGIDEFNWIPEDYWAGFCECAEGLKVYLKEGVKNEES